MNKLGAVQVRSPLAIKAALHGQPGGPSPAAVKGALLELEQACRGIGLAPAAGTACSCKAGPKPSPRRKPRSNDRLLLDLALADAALRIRLADMAVAEQL